MDLNPEGKGETERKEDVKTVAEKAEESANVQTALTKVDAPAPAPVYDLSALFESRKQTPKKTEEKPADSQQAVKAIEEEKAENVSQSVKQKLFDIVMKSEEAEDDELEDEEETDTPEDENGGNDGSDGKDDDENEEEKAEDEEETEEDTSEDESDSVSDLADRTRAELEEMDDLDI